MKSLYVLFVISSFFFLQPFLGYSQFPTCANGTNSGTNKPPCKDCSDPKCKCGSHFDPNTGNAHRETRDLKVWGGVGEIPLTLDRYHNSRGIRNWQVSFNYLMFDAGVNTSGQAQIDVHYPEGGSNTFTQSSSDPNTWLPVPGIDKRVFRDASSYYLQLGNGHRYRFEKVSISGTIQYFLRDFKDQYQNLYTVSYDDINFKRRITEPAGRYIEITFTATDQIGDPEKAVTNDGRSVLYNHDVLNDGLLTWRRLISANYGDGTQALYTYHQSKPGVQPDLEHAIDPRYAEQATNLIYKYSDAAVHGFLYQEFNGVTGEVMATLDATTENRKVCYPTGCQQIFSIPAGQAGNVSLYTDRVGNSTQYTYDNGGIGFLQSTTDPLGRITTYNSRSIYGNPLKITYPDGSTQVWTRDDLDLVLTHKDELGRVISYTRDTRHRPTKIDYPDGTFETFTYNGFSEVLDHQKKSGSTEHFAYDARGLKTSFTDCSGNVTAYTYDAADRLASVIDARGNVMQNQYNERGLLIKMTNADATFKTYAYDAFGNRTGSTDELGHTWLRVYDEFKRPKTMTDPLARITTYGYDLPGGICGCSHTDNLPTKVTLPSGRVTEIEYDHEWRKISETVGAGTADAASTLFEYDVVGNLVKTVDPKLKNWVTAYDVRDRKKSFTDPLGNQTQWTYDFVGNTSTVKRPDNGTTSNVYDNMNRLTQSTDPKAQVTKYTYDADGNMTKLTDPKNNDYNFEHDCLDRKTKMIYPGGSFEQYTFDAVSNLSTYRNRNGDIRTYTYDSRNREGGSSWTVVPPSVATPSISRSYDAASRLLTLISTVSALSYTYNNANEQQSETQNVTGNPAKTVSYTYNADGLRNNLTYPDGTVVNYGYTNRNQLSSVSQGGVLSQYTYDLNDHRINKTLNNGTNTKYSYDDANRMLSVDNKKGAVSFARFDYGYDNVNRRKFVQYDNLKGDVYTYDAIEQVTDVKYNVTNPAGVPGAPARSVNYGLDASGNRTTVTDNITTTSYVTNNLNEYTTAGGAVTYNTNGSPQTLNGWTYTYDAQERLTQALKGGAIVDFLYDGRNRCVKRTINGSQRFLYYDKWNLIDETSSANAQLNRYVHGAMIDEILTNVSPTNTIYYHHDALGSVIHLTDNTGSVVENYSYDIFGAPTIINGSGTIIPATAFGNRFMFTGREYIQEMELYDYRNRVYSKELGKFLQVDPLRFAAGDLNLYRYSNNNPVNFIDPFGTVLGEAIHAAALLAAIEILACPDITKCKKWCKACCDGAQTAGIAAVSAAFVVESLECTPLIVPWAIAACIAVKSAFLVAEIYILHKEATHCHEECEHKPD
jgi:RHS repeat-associated protein